MTPDDPWLGGFVPALLDAGYQAVGVDPEAPLGPEYRRMEFERFDEPTARWCFARLAPEGVHPGGAIARGLVCRQTA